MKLFGRRSSEPEAPPTPAPRQRDPRVGPDPVIDVNTPVSNPELLAAIQTAMAGGGQPADVEAMKIALARAVYLVPVLYDRQPEDRGEGKVRITQGTHVGFLRWSVPGRPELSCFGACISETAYQRCAPDGATQQVITAAQVYSMALRSADSDGVLLNPADDGCLPVYRPWCEDILHLLGR